MEQYKKGKKAFNNTNIWVQYNQMKFDRNKCKAGHLGSKKTRA